MPRLPALLLGALLLAPAAFAAENVINLDGAEAEAALERYQARLERAPDDLEALKAAGILIHQRNRKDPDPESLARGEAYLERAAELAPDDHQTAAWLGSLLTMKALVETDPGRQMFWVKLGTRKLDRAVRAAPDDLVVRLTRAYNSLELPAFLRRTRFAVEDFRHYLALCRDRDCPADELQRAEAGLAEAQAIVARHP